MENFVIYNPVKLRFGKGVLEHLPKSAARHGKRILFIYGKNSIKESGLYQQIIQLLNGFEIIEYQGIKSNPVIEDVNKAAALGREKNADMILAVGGGSVVDSAKVISAAMHYEGNAWDIMKGLHTPEKATPLLAVLTLAATGTEMNPYAVVQNHKTQEKIGWGCPFTYPVESFMDPMLTTTVPKDYTAYGIADMIAHSLEAYFGAGKSQLSDAFVIANIREIIEAGLPLLEDLQNYDLRARIMHAGTVALNGTLTQGKLFADWGVHDIGHILSLLFDMPHGTSLTIAYPAWMRFQSETLADKITFLGKGIFGVDSVEETIEAFEKLFTQLSCPIRISEWGISPEEKPNILKLFIKNQVNGLAHELSDEDRKAILNLMY